MNTHIAPEVVSPVLPVATEQVTFAVVGPPEKDFNW